MKTVIFTDNAPKAIGPYSQAIEINGMLFIPDKYLLILLLQKLLMAESKNKPNR